jgi:hypothetical protein
MGHHRLAVDEHQHPRDRRRDADAREDQRRRDVDVAKARPLAQEGRDERRRDDEVQGRKNEKRHSVVEHRLCFRAHRARSS